MTKPAKDDGRAVAFGPKIVGVVKAPFSLVQATRPLVGVAVLALAVFVPGEAGLHAAFDAAKLPPAATRKVEFAKDIQPLLAERCYSCHGEKKEESGLRLDRKEAALKGGDHGQLLAPGKSAASLIVHVLSGMHDELAKMPKKGEPLTAEQIGLVRAWIDQGADWPATAVASSATVKPHWAFQPITHPATPKLKSKKGIRNEIDSFVVAHLEKEGLKLSAEADKVTLIRRVSLDLTGLPPTPEEVDAFVADRSADAYQKVVERLLKSPQYGEKWARHWLDAARYADSNGFEKDRTRSIWPWRDWVINAINRDLPFDQFTTEQLAGDLLPNPTFDQRVATGFLRNSMLNQEGGIEPEKFRVEGLIDRVDAVGRTWLGLTVACAQCHSHKYDPISQAEYYQFFSLLNQDDEPKLEAPTKDTQAKRDDIRAKARALEDQLMAEPGLAERMAKWEREVADAKGHWQILDAKEWHITPMKFEKQEDLSLLGGGDIYNNGVLRIWVDTPLTNMTGFRLEAMTYPNLPFGGPGLDGTGVYQLCEFTVEATPLKELTGSNVGGTNFVATTNMVKFARAVADAEAPGWGITNAIDGITTNGGWANDFTYGRRNQERRAVFQAEKPVGFEGGTRLLLQVHCKPKESKLSNFLIAHLRLSVTTDEGALKVDPFSEAQRKLLAIPAAQRTPEQRREIFNVYRQHDLALAEANKKWDELWKDWPAAEATTLVLQERAVPRKTRIFKRGDYLKPAAEVTGGTPAFLPPMPADAPKNRLGLARWITDPRNPLTSRVIVNRIWQQYFGQGLVSTPEDFGTRADPASHPELLDWLAGEFMRRSWSQKELHRLIVNSATYRQSSRVTPELLAKDPYNRLLARAPRFRLDAEAVQDVALKAAGLLSPKVGGPSVFPPLPDGVMQMSYGAIPWNVSEGEDRYRRSMYTFWKRSVPYPAMVTFDAPAAEQSCVRRTRSNTPLQALITLNEPSFNNAARWLAWRTMQYGGATEEQRLAYAFRQCLSRKPEQVEVTTLLKLLESSRSEFEAKSKDAASFAFTDPKSPPPLPPGASIPQLAAWSAVTRAILNLDEAVTKE